MPGTSPGAEDTLESKTHQVPALLEINPED